MLLVKSAKAIDKDLVVFLSIILQHRRSLSIKPHKAKQSNRAEQSKERRFSFNHVSSKTANTYIYRRMVLMIWR